MKVSPEAFLAVHAAFQHRRASAISFRCTRLKHAGALLSPALQQTQGNRCRVFDDFHMASGNNSPPERFTIKSTEEHSFVFRHDDVAMQGSIHKSLFISR